jgi:putative membrane protein
MKKLTFFAATVLAVWMLQACGGNTESKHEDSVDSAQAVNKETAPVDKASSDFAVEAADGGMLEVEMGRLAQEKGQSQRVKDFGALLVKDHSKANDDLKSLAAAKNITLPDSVGSDKSDHIRDMGKMTGKDFDKHFIDMMVDDHQKDVDKFEKASTDLTDPDLKTFAGNTLPTLKAHLDTAKAIQEAWKKK